MRIYLFQNRFYFEFKLFLKHNQINLKNKNLDFLKLLIFTLVLIIKSIS